MTNPHTAVVLSDPPLRREIKFECLGCGCFFGIVFTYPNQPKSESKPVFFASGLGCGPPHGGLKATGWTKTRQERNEQKERRANHQEQHRRDGDRETETERNSALARRPDRAAAARRRVMSTTEPPPSPPRCITTAPLVATKAPAVAPALAVKRRATPVKGRKARKRQTERSIVRAAVTTTGLGPFAFWRWSRPWRRQEQRHCQTASAASFRSQQ